MASVTNYLPTYAIPYTAFRSTKYYQDQDRQRWTLLDVVSRHARTAIGPRLAQPVTVVFLAPASA
ncbi:hypothetical protein JMJ77_0006142 [Colletotrichum scovillei]|uniref:Uncharacterized protein n=1 Tax=Colletotrichum scovillei TaxID=1209932 RepID=A0A9P7RI52_9PEZI|nr:hypothetical protein JMJ77_0006142 [Colletotrichum scovillei]KAG7077375.1 hypothetical protein JMJ76_0014623 [Colletotrichum scovillei]KAG7084425.1 hypothetical protein JMJ78_0009860 [Colletotrichum scovillei]